MTGRSAQLRAPHSEFRARLMLTPRYLVPFRPRELPHFFTDVLIIGGGLAGLRAANSIDPKLSGLVVTKDAIQQSNSTYAQGGIAGVMDPDDRFEEHVNDTLVAGGTLCDADVVEMVVREAPGRIQELIDWGTHFDEHAGRIVLGREGGHSRSRIVHALGDMTGREVMRAVIERTLSQPNIRVWENTFTLDLLTHEAECRGAIIANRYNEKMLIWARQTVLAGGGRSLITEAVRGEGGWLVDKDDLRFMPQYDPRAELAPRDIVSQAIVTQMEKTRHPCVYLDVTHLDAAFVLKRFPGIAAACKQFGIDITKDKIPVRPGAHYMIGGVTVDMTGQSTIPGLWAAGEVSSSGLHGANRLASNSLLEGLVYGAHAGAAASRAALAMDGEYRVLPLENPVVAPPAKPLDLDDIRNSLKSLMWRNCGVRRSGEGLAEALEMVDGWRRYVLARQFDDHEGWELQNMLTLARVMIEAALLREESRGVHLRTDYPQLDEAHWNRHLWFQRSEAEGLER